MRVSFLLPLLAGMLLPGEEDADTAEHPVHWRERRVWRRDGRAICQDGVRRDDQL